MVFNNMTEVKIANSNVGQHWFSKESVTHHNSRIETVLFGGKYWIESVRVDDRRCFVIAKIDEITCDITYLTADYQRLQFDSIKDAKMVLKAMKVVA
jgi:hypothetical protein